MDCLQRPFIRVEEAVSSSQRFVTRKNLAQKSNFIQYGNKNESTYLQKFFAGIK